MAGLRDWRAGSDILGPFNQQRHGCLLPGQAGGMEPKTMFLELLAVVAGDHNHRVVIALVLLVIGDIIPQQPVGPGHRVDIAVFNQLDVALTWMQRQHGGSIIVGKRRGERFRPVVGEVR